MGLGAGYNQFRQNNKNPFLDVVSGIVGAGAGRAKRERAEYALRADRKEEGKRSYQQFLKLKEQAQIGLAKEYPEANGNYTNEQQTRYFAKNHEEAASSILEYVNLPMNDHIRNSEGDRLKGNFDLFFTKSGFGMTQKQGEDGMGEDPERTGVRTDNGTTAKNDPVTTRTPMETLDWVLNKASFTAGEGQSMTTWDGLNKAAKIAAGDSAVDTRGGLGATSQNPKTQADAARVGSTPQADPAEAAPRPENQSFGDALGDVFSTPETPYLEDGTRDRELMGKVRREKWSNAWSALKREANENRRNTYQKPMLEYEYDKKAPGEFAREQLGPVPEALADRMEYQKKRHKIMKDYEAKQDAGSLPSSEYEKRDSYMVDALGVEVPPSDPSYTESPAADTKAGTGQNMSMKDASRQVKAELGAPPDPYATDDAGKAAYDSYWKQSNARLGELTGNKVVTKQGMDGPMKIFDPVSTSPEQVTASDASQVADSIASGDKDFDFYTDTPGGRTALALSLRENGVTGFEDIESLTDFINTGAMPTSTTKAKAATALAKSVKALGKRSDASGKEAIKNSFLSANMTKADNPGAYGKAGLLWQKQGKMLARQWQRYAATRGKLSTDGFGLDSASSDIGTLMAAIGTARASNKLSEGEQNTVDEWITGGYDSGFFAKLFTGSNAGFYKILAEAGLSSSTLQLMREGLEAGELGGFSE